MCKTEEHVNMVGEFSLLMRIFNVSMSAPSKCILTAAMIYFLLAGMSSWECRGIVIQGVANMSFHCVLFTITPVFFISSLLLYPYMCFASYHFISCDRLGNCLSSVL